MVKMQEEEKADRANWSVKDNGRERRRKILSEKEKGREKGKKYQGWLQNIARSQTL